MGSLRRAKPRPDRGAELREVQREFRRRPAEIFQLVGRRVEEAGVSVSTRPLERDAIENLETIGLAFLVERHLGELPADTAEAGAADPGKQDIARRSLAPRAKMHRREWDESLPIRRDRLLEESRGGVVVARRTEAVAKRQAELVGAHRQRHDGGVKEDEVGTGRRSGRHRLLAAALPAKQARQPILPRADQLGCANCSTSHFPPVVFTAAALPPANTSMSGRLASAPPKSSTSIALARSKSPMRARRERRQKSPHRGARGQRRRKAETAALGGAIDGDRAGPGVGKHREPRRLRLDAVGRREVDDAHRRARRRARSAPAVRAPASARPVRARRRAEAARSGSRRPRSARRGDAPPARRPAASARRRPRSRARSAEARDRSFRARPRCRGAARRSAARPRRIRSPRSGRSSCCGGSARRAAATMRRSSGSPCRGR